MNAEIQQEFLMTLPAIFTTLGLIYAVAADSYTSRRNRGLMSIIICLLITLIAQNIFEYMVVNAEHPNIQVRIALAVYGYVVRPIIIVMFIEIVSDENQILMPWILAGVNLAIHLTAFFSGICFTIRPDNTFVRGPFGYTCHLVSAILIIWLLYISVRDYSSRPVELAIPVLNVIMVTVATVLDINLGTDYIITLLTSAIAASSVFYYIWLHLQFVKRHEDDLRAKQRIQIMMSQIQPHFLYNTLATIQALCVIDPKKASDTTEKFGTYLRQNLDIIGQESLIPFEKELDHTKIYTDIEALRFPNIEVIYETEDTDFQVPALTVQPLVENAIRHGVRIRPNGIVKVTSKKTETGYEIAISDNGKGFDTSSIATMEKQHIGLRNVKERIEKMCGGTMTIESEENKGTTITMFIPDTAAPEKKRRGIFRKK